MVQNGHSGFVVRSGSPEALATAIIEALNNPGMRLTFAANARRYTEAHLTAEITAGKVMEVYDSILRTGGVGAKRG